MRTENDENFSSLLVAIGDCSSVNASKMIELPRQMVTTSDLVQKFLEILPMNGCIGEINS